MSRGLRASSTRAVSERSTTRGGTSTGLAGSTRLRDLRSNDRPSPSAAATHRFGDLSIHAPAGRSTSAQTPGRLPHIDRIQQAFGHHDLSSVRAWTDGAARAGCSQLGAQAITWGSDVLLARPTLFNSAHEAAHVVQQRRGLQGDPHSADHESSADAVARAVCEGRSAEPMLDAFPSGPTHAALQCKDDDVPDPNVGEPLSAAEDKVRQETTSDLDAIVRAGERERKEPESATQTMLNGASIVYRILRVFHPDLEKSWWISGIGGTRSVSGLRLKRTGGKNVHIDVGRDFILATDASRLHDRAGDVGRAFAALAALPADQAQQADQAIVDAATISEAQAIEEGGRLFVDKAKFGVASGAQAGADPGDGYDARYWKEEWRSLVAKVEPWLAMSMLVQYVGGPVPRAGGGTTVWHFDCFEGMDVVRKYAQWRTLSRDAFNRLHGPLRIGFNAYQRGVDADDLEPPVLSEGPGRAPYTRGDTVATMKGGEVTFEMQKIPVAASMNQVLADAPVGSYVCFTNADVTARLLKHGKDKAAGKPISETEQSFIDKITPWNSENALKLGPDRYSAFPLGIVDAATIMHELAKIVHEPNPVPAGYIARNIYVSSVARKKPVP